MVLNCVILLQLNPAIVAMVYMKAASPTVGVSDVELIPNDNFTCGKRDPD